MYQLATLNKGSLSIQDYFNKAKGFADILSTIGQNISESEVISYILSGFPTDYDSLVTFVTTQTESMSLDDLYGYLLIHELRIEQQAASMDINLPTAYMATRSFFNQGRDSRNTRNISQGSTNYGGRSRGRGHGHGGPPNALNFPQYSKSSLKLLCQICLKPGHGAPSCWHRFEQNY